MLPYLIFLIVVPTLSTLIVRSVYETNRISITKRAANIMIPVFFISLIILLSLRGAGNSYATTCGRDLLNYKPHFLQTSKLSFSEVWKNHDDEQLYYMLNKFVALFGNFQVFLAVCAVISLVPVAIFYYKESNYAFLTIILFMTVTPFNMFFSGLRQAIAMGLAIPAWYCAKKKKVILFLAIVLIAFFFHKSAFVMLLIYPFYHFKITAKRLIFFVPFLIVGYLFKDSIFLFFTNYVFNDYAANYGEVVDTGAGMMALLYLIFVIYAYVIMDEKKADHDAIALRNILLLVLFIQIFGAINHVVTRLNFYFELFLPVLISKVIYYSKDNLKNIAHFSNIVMSVFFTIYFFVDAYFGADILGIFPYVGFWQT